MTLPNDLRWTNDLSVEIPEMDDEHRYLIELMNQLNHCTMGKVDIERTNLAFQQLIEYTQQHFRDEEAMLERMDYPDLKKHKAAHEDLLSRLDREYKQFQNGFSSVGESLFNFLKFWLKQHIHGMDKKYCAFHSHKIRA